MTIENNNEMNTDPRPADAAGNTPAAVAPIVPLVINAKQAAAMMSTTEKTIGNWNRSGLMPRCVHYPSTGTGKRAPAMWLLDELKQWVAAGLPNRQQWERLKADAIR